MNPLLLHFFFIHVMLFEKPFRLEKIIVSRCSISTTRYFIVLKDSTHEKCDEIRDPTSSIKMSLSQLVNRNNWKVLSYLRDFRKSPMILSPSLEKSEKRKCNLFDPFGNFARPSSNFSLRSNVLDLQ